MSRHTDLNIILNKKDIVQVVTETLREAMGEVAEILSNYIILKPHKNETISEEFGQSIDFTTIIPLEDVRVILILRENQRITNGD
jgi:hypothetical protein